MGMVVNSTMQMTDETVPKFKSQMFWRTSSLAIFILGAIGTSFPVSADAESDVKFKMLAVNPSQDQTIKAKISQNLPSEVDPAKDIIDKAGLEVRFDSETKSYSLVGETELKPRETKTFEVRIRDVWRITPEQVEIAKKSLDDQITALKGTKYYDTAQLLYQKAQEGIDRILDEQGKPVGIKQHIELFRAHAQQLQNIQANALSLGAMRQLENEKTGSVDKVQFVINAENPSSEPKAMTIRSALPKEVTADDIIEKQDFAILFDQSQRAYVLQKEDQFLARETKKYIITLRNIWRVPDPDIKFAREQTEKLLALFKGSAFEKYAEEHGKVILDILTEITNSQAELDSSLLLEDRMRAFVLNTQRMNVANAKLNNLQQLIQEVSLKKDDSQVLEKIKYFVKKLAETKNVVLMAMGLQPNTPMVWWIIFGIIFFLGILSTIFYVVWLKKLQENKWGIKKAGRGSMGEPPVAAQADESFEEKSKEKKA